MSKFSTTLNKTISLILMLNSAQAFGEWFADPQSGCKIWDDSPQPTQSVKYEGSCLKKLAQGQGKATFFQNGSFDQSWDANWIEGKTSGKLTITYSDGSKYHGELLNGKQDGKGSAEFANGDSYEGEFRNGKFNGNGVFLKKEGWRYTGQFEHSQLSGKGTYYYADGSKYEGEFKDNKFNGNGVYYDSTGSVKASGLFENDTFIPQVSRAKLETIAECYSAAEIIASDFTIRGDFKNEQNAKKVTQYLSDRFFYYAGIYTRKMPPEIARSTYELTQNSLKKYTYMDDLAQLKYALGVSKNLNCLEQAK